MVDSELQIDTIKWNKIMETLKQSKLQEDAKAFRKKMIMGKEKK